MESIVAEKEAAIYLTNIKNELCILETPEDIEAALKIRFIRQLYGSYTFCGNRMGGSPEHAIMLSNINFNTFIHVLHLLKLQIEEGGVPFTNQCIAYTTLLSEKWELQILPRTYLSYVETLSTMTLVECMTTCSQLSLHELRKLLMYRIVYVLNQKTSDIDVFRSTWECILTLSDYDLAVFQKTFREFTAVTEQNAASFTAIRARHRSQSF